MPLLEVNGLTVKFPVRGPGWFRRSFLTAVDDVSFTLDEGEILGLVGESGCGKSTLGRALVKLEEPASGKILLDGNDLTALRGGALRRARRNFQMIFQDPYGSLNPRLSIRATLDEVLRIHFRGENAARRGERAEALLRRVGLDPVALDRYPHQFSGGQRQRIGIARALAAEPKFIVADEPVSALDVSVQAAIVNLIGDIRRESGTAFLFIAHDLAVVEHVSQRIMVMYLGRAVEVGPAREVTGVPLHPYTRALLSAVPTLSPEGRRRIVLPGDVPSPLAPPEGCAFHPRCPLAGEECRKCRPALREAAPGHFVACFKESSRA